jgi:hypothetical protein
MRVKNEKRQPNKTLDSALNMPIKLYCIMCGKPMKKIDKYTWKSTCGHFEDLALSVR